MTAQTLSAHVSAADSFSEGRSGDGPDNSSGEVETPPEPSRRERAYAVAGSTLRLGRYVVVDVAANRAKDSSDLRKIKGLKADYRKSRAKADRAHDKLERWERRRPIRDLIRLIGSAARIMDTKATKLLDLRNRAHRQDVETGRYLTAIQQRRAAIEKRQAAAKATKDGAMGTVRSLGRSAQTKP